MFRNLLMIILVIGFTMQSSATEKKDMYQLNSPSDNIRIEFLLDKEGKPHYRLFHKDNIVIDTSSMGFEFKKQPTLTKGFRIVDVETSEVDETWEMPWGEQREVRNHYREMIVFLEKKEQSKRNLKIYFRAYNDGIAFRYEFPEQDGIDSLIITDEKTQFNLTGNHLVWWTPGDWDIYEHLYNTTRLTEIDAISKRDHPDLAQTHIPYNAVNTPVTMRTEEGLHISFHEADLTNYAGMTLRIDKENLLMESELVGSDRYGYKVKRKLPFNTPWRTIQISEGAAGLIESKLIVNLNEPNKLGDVSWFKPMKYAGIWWEMHLGVSSWDMQSGKHGATTENAKRYIDFAAANNIGGVLIEGWNTGWEHWIGFEDREGVFDFITPYPDYNLKEVVEYAKDKGVQIIMHHETSAAPRTYEQQLDSAYKLMQDLGIHVVKTGYVGKIIPKGEYHHGQWMVNHYHKVLTTAAEHKVAVNAHEPIKATGKRRSWPNAVSREGLRGQEFNAWATDGGNPPEHLSIVAFTRMLGGPIDYTPGIFDIKLSEKKDNPNKNQVNTTLAQQLALYVVIYSPVQMVADLPGNYQGKEAFQFIKDVGVDWEQTKVLNGEVGEYVTIAREERNTGNWFLGSITDENERKMEISFDFLEKGKEYNALVYKDGKDAHWDKNPESIEVEKKVLTSDSKETFKLAAGGGLAISLIPKE